MTAIEPPVAPVAPVAVTAPPSLPDALGDVLRDLRLDGAFYARSELTAPWGVDLPAFDGTLMLHVLTAGRCWLTIGDEDVGSMETEDIFSTMVSFSGLDIGLDRSSPVSHYEAPNVFTGHLIRVVVDMDHDQALDHDAAGRTELARE